MNAVNQETRRRRSGQDDGADVWFCWGCSANIGQQKLHSKATKTWSSEGDVKLDFRGP